MGSTGKAGILIVVEAHFSLDCAIFVAMSDYKIENQELDKI